MKTIQARDSLIMGLNGWAISFIITIHFPVGESESTWSVSNMTATTVKHLDLDALDQQISTLFDFCQPLTEAETEAWDEFKSAANSHIVTEYLAETGLSDNRLINVMEALTFMFESLGIKQIQLLGFYRKSVQPNETYVDFLNSLVLVLQFDE